MSQFISLVLALVLLSIIQLIDGHRKLKPSVDKYVYRRKWVATVLISAAVTSILPHNAFAQIPNMDQYNTGSGTKIRDTTPSIASAPSPIDISNASNLKTALNRIKDSISKQSWDEALLDINAISKSMKSNNYMINGIGKDTIDELKVSLIALSDVCVQNRVIYFNKEDLELVQIIKKSDDDDTIQSSINEATDLVDSIERML